jgi:transcriptional regulator with XRE-family HTH domain
MRARDTSPSKSSRPRKPALPVEKQAGARTWSRPRREPDTIEFGRKLQALRSRRGWSLADVAKKSGISMATLSRIENNKLSPTLDIVARLLNGLEIPYHELFIASGTTVAPGFCVVTKRGRGQMIRVEGASFEVLSRVDDPSAFYAVVLTIRARATSETHGLAAHDGEEFLHVLSGVLELHRQGFPPCVLMEGDSVFFDSGVPHDYVCGSQAPTSVLILTINSMQRGSGEKRRGVTAPSRLRQFAGLKI